MKEELPRPTYIYDKSGNGTTLEIEREYIYDDILLQNYAYSFAVVPDTQKVALTYPEEFEKIYDYIIDNAEKYNTKFVIGLGDITNDDTNHEWAVAKSQIDRLGSVLPFSIVRGNHDSEDKYNQFFSYDEYKNTVSGSYDASMLTTYNKFKVGNVKYLVINLDYLPTDDEIAWACEIVEENPDYNVIITTHSYLHSYREAGTATDIRYEHAEKIWKNLAGAYKNVVMVLCGHSTSHDIAVVKDVGVHGNTVAQIRIDGQDYDVWNKGVGVVAMLHFSEDGKNVQVRYYSTIKKAYFYNENQFTLELDTLDASETAQAPEIKAEEFSCRIKLDGNITGKIFAALYDSRNNLSEAKVYDAAPRVDISFSDYVSGSKLKIFWWDGETLTPVVKPNILNINVSK